MQAPVAAAAVAGQPAAAAAGGQRWQLQLRAPAIAGTATVEPDPASTMGERHQQQRCGAGSSGRFSLLTANCQLAACAVAIMLLQTPFCRPSLATPLAAAAAAWSALLPPHPPACLASLFNLVSPADWQHSLSLKHGGAATAAALQQQQHTMQACGPTAAAAATAAAETDPWCSGLDLMAANSSADEALPLLDLTDAGLDALLAPFEEWPCMLQPPSAALPALQPPARAQQPLSSASPAPSSQQQGSAAASPRSSSGTSPACAAAELGSGGAGGKAPRRKGGRPRIHHPRTPPASAAAAAAAAAGASQADSSAASVQHYKQGGRGPKPKYVFATQVRQMHLRGSYCPALQWLQLCSSARSILQAARHFRKPCVSCSLPALLPTRACACRRRRRMRGASATARPPSSRTTSEPLPSSASCTSSCAGP